MMMATIYLIQYFILLPLRLEHSIFQQFWLGKGAVGAKQSLPSIVAVLIDALEKQKIPADVGKSASPAEGHDSTTVRLLTDIVYGIKRGKAPFVLKEWHSDFESYDILTADSVGVSVWIPLGAVNHTVEGGSLIIANQSLVDTAICPSGI
jgi:hypothetical protein